MMIIMRHDDYLGSMLEICDHPGSIWNNVDRPSSVFKTLAIVLAEYRLSANDHPRAQLIFLF
jgi:hypothetical protein